MSAARPVNAPIPTLVHLGAAATYLLSPLWLMFVGGLFTGWTPDSLGLWIGASIFLYMIVIGFLFRSVFVVPIRFHSDGPSQDL